MSFNTRKSNEQLPDIPIDQAEKTLENVFNACNKEPNKTPLTMLMVEHKNIMRFHRAIISLCIIGLVFLIICPLSFIRPQFSLNTQLINQNMITMNIEVSKIMKPVSIDVTMNNKPLPIKKVSDSLYLVEITDNGELEVIVTGFNYQQSLKTSTISNLK
nr:hypothetical protein [uncultured Acetobacterium sp.]